MAGPPLRRKFRIVMVVEGDTWEDAGEAATRAIAALNQGKPNELRDDGVPYEVKVVDPADTYGWSLEISRDEKMTHEAYADLKRQAAGTAAGVSETVEPGSGEGAA